MYHFIGIKGSGMSGLAVLMKQLGYNVQGSDYNKHYFTEDGLIRNDIKVLCFNRDNIKDDMIIVKGNTFDDSNEEVLEAKKRNLLIYTYQEMVNIITSKYNLIAVSGCHGKTTTSSMLAHVLDSNYLIGDGSGNICDSNYFVLEACEYKRHFLEYNPNYIIITNIDLDHVDFFHSIDEVFDAYNDFSKKGNIIIACGDNDYTKKLKHDNIYYYGVNSNNYFQAKDVKYSCSGIEFDLFINGLFERSFSLPFFGSHMLLNTLAVISVCYLEGINMDSVYERLLTFKGAKRRFNELKVLDNVVIDDYAHHPNEIKSLIDAAHQKYPGKKFIGVFEPHTFSRTKRFYKEIAFELNKLDYSYIMDIYPSREKQEDYYGITSNLIIDNLYNGEFIGKNEVSKLLNYNNSVLLFMSPNDLSSFEKKYVEMYKNQV